MSLNNELLADVLRDVSRAFYLSMRILPNGVREPISVAYLLARAADTIADTPGLPASDKLARLESFKQALQAESGAGPADWEEHRPELSARAEAGERVLLQRVPDIFRLFFSFSMPDILDIRQVVSTLISGMEMDLREFPGAFATQSSLDTYTYLVAGCVGRFWTRITLRHVAGLEAACAKEPQELERLGVCFGQALQLTNILRDIPKDLANGRCYLPNSVLAALVPKPNCADSNDSNDSNNSNNSNNYLNNTNSLNNTNKFNNVNKINENKINENNNSDQLAMLTSEHRLWLRRARPELKGLLEQAVKLYSCAVDYALALPFYQFRLRLAVLWPILIGLGTLKKLAASEQWLNPRVRVKVSRRFVYKTMLLSALAVPFTPILRCWLNAALRAVELQEQPKSH